MFLVGFMVYCVQEKLCSMLKDVLKSKPNVDVVKLHKSGGVVLRNQKVRQKTRSLRIRVSVTSQLSLLNMIKETFKFSSVSSYYMDSKFSVNVQKHNKLTGSFV